MDTLLLFWAARRLSKGTEPAPWDRLAWGGLLTAGACIASLTIFGTASVRLTIGGLLVALTLVWGWRASPARFKRFVRRGSEPIEARSLG